MNGPRQKTEHCGARPMASRSYRFSAVASLRGNVSPCREAVHGPARIAWSELFPQWRLVDFSEVFGGARMVKPGEPTGSGARIDRAWPTGSHPPRIADGLQAVRSHALPARLRPIKARHGRREILAHGVRAGRPQTIGAAQRKRSSPLETCQKIKIGGPVAERNPHISFRHGTRGGDHDTENGLFRSATERNPPFLGVAAFRHGSPIYIAMSPWFFCSA